MRRKVRADDSALAPRASQLVTGLSRQERLVVMLLYAEELTVVEAAAVLGVTPAVVRRVDARVTRRVRTRLTRKPK